MLVCRSLKLAMTQKSSEVIRNISTVDEAIYPRPDVPKEFKLFPDSSQQSKYKTNDRSKKTVTKGQFEFLVMNVFSSNKVIVVTQQNCPLNTLLVISRTLQKRASSEAFSWSPLRASTCDVWKTEDNAF